MDELLVLFNLLTLIILFSSFLVSFHLYNFMYFVFITFMIISCLCVFSLKNVFFIYLFYEASLIPIIYIILKWGVYPERSLRAVILLIFTSLFSVPFMFVLMQVTIKMGSFTSLIRTRHIMEYSWIIVCLTFFTFAAKLPIYGLHFWLPIAHVEAPTFGSMILAGVLLKLGGAGLIRFSWIFNFIVIKKVLLSYFMVVMVYVGLVCIIQRDFKRLVAYSSVFHIIVVPLLLISNNNLSYQAFLIVIFLHGLSSPLIFIIVGVIYKIYGSRQFVVLRGLALIRPVLRIFLLIIFFFTISAPPFPSFVAEVFFMASSSFLSDWLYLVYGLFLFVSIVYNLVWLTRVVFFSPNSLVLSHRDLNFSSIIVSFFLITCNLFYFLGCVVFWYVIMRTTWVSRV